MTTKDEYAQGKVFAALPRTTRGVPLVLGATPKGDKVLWCNGHSVFIVNLADVTDVDIYTEHPVPTTVAKYSPSGYYCASGDSQGNVRIWDTTQTTHILKATYPVIGGPIRDISWSEDSKRVAAVGEGRDRFGHVFLFDTGTSNGSLSGQSRSMTSIDFRPARPYRLVSGSEDNSVALFEGPPFKFSTTLQNHTRFVHVVRYNPDGSLFASASADGKVFICDGTTGANQFEFVDPAVKGGSAHSGGVYGLAWSPDGKRLATSSGDKSVKIWNIEGKQLEKAVQIGNDVEDQQLSTIWLPAGVLSVSLSGFINFVDPDQGKVTRTLFGHNKPITAFWLTPDKSTAYTADFEGNISKWNTTTGEAVRIQPKAHKSQVSGLTTAADNHLVSVGWDDTIVFTKDAGTGGASQVSHKLPAQPLGVAATTDGKIVFVATQKGVAVYKDRQPARTETTSYPTSCVAVSPDAKLVAVGGQDSKVRVYAFDGATFTLKKELNHQGSITAVGFNPSGELLAATDSSRKVVLYAVSRDFVSATDKEWTFHNGRVNCLAWSQNGRYLATGGLDTAVIVWDSQKSGEHPLIIRGAHAMSPINAIGWLGEKELISVGQDANLKTWTVKI